MTSFKLNAIVLSIAIICGFALPTPAQNMSWAVLPLLALIVFLSARKVHISIPTKHEFAVTIELFAVSYFVLSAIYVLLGLGISEPGVQIGIWLLALMPPAINVIPLSQLLKGNVKESMLAAILGLIVAMIVIPVGAHFFFGTAISTIGLAKVLVLGILIPSGIGIVCRKLTFLDKPTSYIIPTVNALIFYVLIGSNSDILISNVDSLYFWTIVGVLIFVKCGFVSWINMKFAEFQSKKERVDVVLFASFKNVALAAAIAMVAFPNVDGILIPIAIESVLFCGQLLFIEHLLTGVVKQHVKSK